MSSARTVRVASEAGAHTLEVRVQSPASPDAATPKVVIAPPHPLYGGDADNPVVRELESAFVQRGFGTLALDFRGVGGSTGTQHGNLDDACADFMSVARNAAAQPLAALAGYSFGACAAVLAAQALAVQSLVLVAPAIALLDAAALARCTCRVRIVVGDDDDYAPTKPLEALVAKLPNARLEVLSGVDHFFMGSQRLALREALARAFD